MIRMMLSQAVMGAAAHTADYKILHRKPPEKHLGRCRADDNFGIIVLVPAPPTFAPRSVIGKVCAGADYQFVFVLSA
jgi:hypothetical protein